MNNISELLQKNNGIHSLKEVFRCSLSISEIISSFNKSKLNRETQIEVVRLTPENQGSGCPDLLSFPSLIELYKSESKTIKPKDERLPIIHGISRNGKRTLEDITYKSCLYFESDHGLPNLKILEQLEIGYICSIRSEAKKHHLIFPLSINVKVSKDTKLEYVSKYYLIQTALETLMKVEYDTTTSDYPRLEYLYTGLSSDSEVEVIFNNNESFIDFDRLISNLEYMNLFSGFCLNQVFCTHVHSDYTSLRLERTHVQPLQETPKIDPDIDRARNYISKIPGAVEHQKGHNTTFKVACRLAIDFDLNWDQSFSLFQEYNLRCVPEWSNSELIHKMEDAFKKKTLLATDEIGRLNNLKAARTFQETLIRTGLLSDLRNTVSTYVVLAGSVWKRPKNANQGTLLRNLLDQGYICVSISQDRLSKKVGIARQNIISKLRSLEESFNIIRILKSKEDKRYAHNVYVLGKDGKYYIDYLEDEIFERFYSDDKPFDEIVKLVKSENKWIEKLPVPLIDEADYNSRTYIH